MQCLHCSNWSVNRCHYQNKEKKYAVHTFYSCPCPDHLAHGRAQRPETAGFLACIITVIITAFESICIWHFSSANMLTAALEGALNAIWPICRRRMSCCQFYAYSVWVCRRSHRDHFRNHRTCPGGDRGSAFLLSSVIIRKNVVK